MRSLLFARQLVLLLAVLSPCSLCAPAWAQSDPHSNVFLGGDKPKKEKTPTSRSVKGTVIDGEGKPLDGALVTLTKGDTHESTTFITKQDGHYNFDGLSFTTDYKLAAQYKGAKSEAKTLSQYDRTPYIVRMLAIAADDKKPPAAASNNPK